MVYAGWFYDPCRFVVISYCLSQVHRNISSAFGINIAGRMWDVHGSRWYQISASLVSDIGSISPYAIVYHHAAPPIYPLSLGFFSDR
jgi:hypothetical protein